MGKIVAFMNALKLKKGEAVIEDMEDVRDGGDDYAVEKKSTSFYVMSVIVSAIGAILIWLFAVNGGMTEKLFTVHPDFHGKDSFVSAAEQSGFTVVFEKDATVSFALVGRQKTVNNIVNDNIAVYVDLEPLISEVDKLPNNTEQILSAEIIINAPVYFGVEDISKEKITIKLVPINKVTE